MRELILKCGAVTLVDDDDYDRFSRHVWHLLSTGTGRRYVKRYSSEKPKTLSLHREIMRVTDAKIQVDHIDGDTLNNQKSNLRLATNAQNQYNTNSRKGSSSPYKGVSKLRDKWQAKICKNYKTIQLGIYTTQEDAAKAYNTAALKYFGEFAKLNVIQTQDA